MCVVLPLLHPFISERGNNIRATMMETDVSESAQLHKQSSTRLSVNHLFLEQKKQEENNYLIMMMKGTV